MIENCPWTYHYDDCDEYGNGEIHDSCGGFIAITTGPNYGAWHKDGHSHFEGIARLISAAPTQYEEMLRYLPIIERAEADTELWERLTDGTGIATANGYRAAIAKATGE